ncbi:MAG: hypothetical protein DHS20C01_00870 [marine bacterium B5-7]|nr:MAG: hypothetical protein DHS20C01_00870 [marine bacterium B5-7]
MRKDRALVIKIVRAGRRLEKLTNSELRTRAMKLRDQSGLDVNNLTLVVEAFSLVRESARRALGMAHYNVQLLAGLALMRGTIAEMATGEGKTLVTTLPASVHGFIGNGVHVMTVNPYLAERDFFLMKPVYELLGLNVGHLVPGASVADKRTAYAADITYGVGAEFGFDYLRDQLALLRCPRLVAGQALRRRLRGDSEKQADTVQRGFEFAIIDEADSVMIDEAGSALILSGSSGQPSAYPDLYHVARRVVADLEESRDLVIDRRHRSIGLTVEGQRRALDMSPTPLPRGLTRPWPQYLEQALKARFFFSRDVEYVIQDGKIQIVDQFTGRRFEDRNWSDGLHQAVEAEENVPITEESQSLLKISRQRFFGLYKNLCGMTGTASGSEDEFREFFNRPVVPIPLNRPSRRKILKTRFFTNLVSKRQAIVDEVRRINARNQPVLLGTRTVYESEILSELLTQAGIVHRVLNARQDQEEADIISQAGQRGAVTIATNMAGRGSDIPLGEGAERLGGLNVIGSEMHESSRVDRQLLGRAARQGDPGTGRFFVSAEDALIRDHAPDLAVTMTQRVRRDGESSRNYQREIKELQQRIEARRFEQRRHLYKRDQWMEKILEHAV